MSWRRGGGAALGLLLGVACSSVQHVWQAADYRERPDAAAPPAADAVPVKRVAVVAWQDGHCPGLGDVLATVVADLVKLHKNYVVLAPQTARLQWAEGCTQGATGVIFVRPLQCRRDSLQVELHLAMELYRCADGALLWRAEAADGHRTNDPSLSDLTNHYAADLGPRAALYSAPAFAVAQDLVGRLPDPQLSDAEVLEKIEIGALLPQN